MLLGTRAWGRFWARGVTGLVSGGSKLRTSDQAQLSGHHRKQEAWRFCTRAHVAAQLPGCSSRVLCCLPKGLWLWIG